MKPNNFYIDKSDRLPKYLRQPWLNYGWPLRLLDGITLFGAAIGLMNIMLVAVNERTREIGLIKAIGGKSKSIRPTVSF